MIFAILQVIIVKLYVKILKKDLNINQNHNKHLLL